MLVLSRKVNEEIRIDGGIVVKVTEISGGKVKLGIVAPITTRVKRAELEDIPRAPRLIDGNLFSPGQANHQGRAA